MHYPSACLRDIYCGASRASFLRYACALLRTHTADAKVVAHGVAQLNIRYCLPRLPHSDVIAILAAAPYDIAAVRAALIVDLHMMESLI